MPVLVYQASVLVFLETSFEMMIVFLYFDTLARFNSSSLISCSETGILSNLIVGARLSDSSSKYLIQSLTNARAANCVRDGILLDCLAGRFIDCSIFSAANREPVLPYWRSRFDYY